MYSKQSDVKGTVHIIKCGYIFSGITGALPQPGALGLSPELNRSLQLKCEDIQLEAQRQLEQIHQKEELVKQYCFQIQETKLKHRKIRATEAGAVDQAAGRVKPHPECRDAHGHL
ncbi:hypothetical protein DPX16_7627 [Anabarilius grahami]|uniref:Uncharacterized protein n=1 Tax=Anabarilius grahami TaxID=495550 RepID=A0A3N0YS41_ANAGA|nr:hypothetical protein DPX16_7627 [Anabarilius grahami]